MKKVIFVLGIAGAMFMHIVEGSANVPPTEMSISIPPLRVALSNEFGSTPPVTVRTIELIDDSRDIELLAAQITELQRQIMSLSNGFAADLGSRKERTKKAASVESVRRLSQAIDSRFEEQNKRVCELMEKLNALSSEIEKAQIEKGKTHVEGIQRLSQTVDRRLDLLGLHVRMSMIAFNTLSSEVKEMESALFSTVKDMKEEIEALKVQNSQLQQKISDLTGKPKGDE